MRSRRKPFKSSLFPVNGFSGASFNSVGLGAGGSSGKMTGLMFGCQIGDSTGDTFRVGSGFSGVFGWVLISIVLIFNGSGCSSLDRSFFCNMFRNNFLTGLDSSGAVW